MQDGGCGVRDVRTQGGRWKGLGCRTQPWGSAACETWIWGREWRMFDLGRGMEDERPGTPQAEAGLGRGPGQAAVHDLCLSVCPLSPPALPLLFPFPW